METNDIIFVQNQIGYEFSNSDLLQQAFIRRSYANEMVVRTMKYWSL